MKRRPVSKSHAFLIELTIVLLFFSLCAAIALGLFVNAHNADERARLTTIALMDLQSIAETAKATEDLPAMRTYVASIVDGDDYSLRADLKEESRTAGTMAILTLSAADPEGEGLLEIKVQKYFAGGLQ